MNATALAQPVFYEPGSLSIIDAVNTATLRGVYSQQPLEDIRQEYPSAICIEFEDAFKRITQLNHEKYIEPKARTISEDEWTNALECLPPCRFGTTSGIEHFHISERLTQNIVAWYSRDGHGNYVRFNDFESITRERVVERHREAI